MPKMYGEPRTRWGTGLVWVVIYDHEYGTDVNLHHQEASAWATVGEILKRNVEELNAPELEEEILGLLDKGNVKRALTLWKNADTGEMLYIERHTVTD